MSYKCKDCRFYEPKRCSVYNNNNYSGCNAICQHFVAYSTRNQSELKKCRDCRFFTGNSCLEFPMTQSPNSAVCPYGSIIK